MLSTFPTLESCEDAHMGSDPYSASKPWPAHDAGETAAKNSPKGKRDREAARFDVQGITGSLIERDALMLDAFARCKPKGLPDPIRHSRNRMRRASRTTAIWLELIALLDRSPRLRCKSSTALHYSARRLYWWRASRFTERA